MIWICLIWEFVNKGKQNDYQETGEGMVIYHQLQLKISYITLLNGWVDISVQVLVNQKTQFNADKSTSIPITNFTSNNGIQGENWQCL